MLTKKLLSACLVMGAVLTLSTGCQAQAAKDTAHATAAETESAPVLPERMRGLAFPLRGPTTSEEIDTVIERVAELGANWVRINIRPDNAKGLEPAPTSEDPLLPYRPSLVKLRSAINTAKKYNMVITVSVVPWGRNQDYFQEKEEGNHYQDHLPQFWTAFAKEFKDEPIAIYDLMAEPNFVWDNPNAWQKDLLPKCIAAVRAVNKSVWLSVQLGHFGVPEGFDNFDPIDDPYVVYTFDSYAPHTYTHQGIGKDAETRRPRGKVYPGVLKKYVNSPEILWDKDQMRKYYAEAKNFADKYHVRMMCEEFGIVRWAPGNAQWTQDTMDVFEEYGFDWAAFTLVGWNGWNPTFPADYAPTDDKGWWKTDGGLWDSPIMKIWKAGWALNNKE